MTKIVLNDIASLTNEQSALTLLNSNSAIIETASDNTLSRDGTAPNHMLADLDMNSNDILNLPEPINPTSPLRLQDLSDFLGTGTISTGVPANTPVITASLSGDLTAERVLTAGSGVTLADGGANSTMTVDLNTASARNKLHPMSSTDNAVVRYDGTTGDLQNSGVLIDDTNNVTGISTLTTDGSVIIRSGTSQRFNFSVTDSGLEIGRTDNVAGSAFIDFHTGATSTDFDTRLISDGATGVTGGGRLEFIGAGGLVPSTNDAAALGSTTKAWSDLFLASGAVLNFNNGNYTLTHSSGKLTASADIAGVLESFVIACSDETTALNTGTNKVKFRMPYALTVTDIRGSLSTAQTSGAIFTVDVNEAGTSILSTKLTIDNTEVTSTTAATARVISDSALADDAEISIDIDQVGDGTAKGLKVYIIGKRP
jgi:hypothetical protein